MFWILRKVKKNTFIIISIFHNLYQLCDYATIFLWFFLYLFYCNTHDALEDTQLAKKFL